MRRAFVVAAFAAAMATAGDVSAQAFQFGPMAGVSIANFSGDDAEDSDSRTGLFAGAQVVWQSPGALFGLETGAAYVQKGATIQDDIEGEGTIELSYIEVPVLLRVAPPMGSSSFTPAFALGASVGFEVGCNLSGEGDGVDVDVDCEEAEVETKSVDFGLTASAGVDVPVGGMTLAPFVRYTHGLTNIPDEGAEDTDVKNSVIMIGAGLRFGR